MRLSDPRYAKELMEKYSVSPKKAFGQNFLINPRIPESIAEKAREYCSGDGPHGVIEIGPGIGSMTECLSKVFERVVAVELDRDLIPLLGEALADCGNTEVVEGDFMSLDLPSFIDKKFGDITGNGGTVTVCANLPYYITSPIIMKILESYPLTERIPLSSVVVMVQKEVASRLTSAAGSPDYGAITASVNLRARAEKLFDVSPGNFLPPPKVSSSVVGIVPHGGIREVFPECPEEERRCIMLGVKTYEIISLAFGQRRKTLVNSLSSVYPKDVTSEVLRDMGLREDIRGERLSAGEFARLADKLITVNG